MNEAGATITVLDVITIIALVAGPIFAVTLTLVVEARRERRRRRLDIFRTLMRTRRWQQSADHVGALNLVEIEFHRDRQVRDAWRRLFDHLGRTHPRRPDEEISSDHADEERHIRNERYNKRIADERQKLLTQLLHSMAQALGFRIEQLEIFEGGYTPQGWGDVEFEQRVIRQYFVDLYQGRRVVPVAVFDYTRHYANNQRNKSSTETPEDKGN